MQYLASHVQHENRRPSFITRFETSPITVIRSATMDQGTLTPRQIVTELDKYIIGQDDAKRAVAIAVRNRWRRQQLDEEIAHEVSPKNIIMVGPTGVGKTEVARRLARLVQAPFIKVEASKYTEVGYHGRDVESMIRDLLDLAINIVRREQSENVKDKADTAVENRLLDILLGKSAHPVSPTGGADLDDFFSSASSFSDNESESSQGGYVSAERSKLGAPESSAEDAARKLMLKKLREGVFEDREIEVTVTEQQTMPIIGGMSGDQIDPGMMSMLEQIMPKRHRTRKVTVAEARRIFMDEETEKLIDHEKSVEVAIQRTEQSGIVFLDEIDKIASGGSNGHGSADVSRQGVQRDLLPIVEGSTVSTRYGMVRTDHVLFIAAGAFHSASVSDLMPELQGRFPIRVELSALTREDFVRILKEPEHSLIKQQQALLGTEGLEISFDDDAIDSLANYAAQANSKMENIGARRLMTVVERLFETISFDAPEMVKRGETSVRVTAEMVKTELDAISRDEDLSKFVL